MSKNRTPEPPWLTTEPPGLVKRVRLPAVALFVNCITPWLRLRSISVRKFCVIPELFVMPTPLMVKVNEGLAVIVNTLALALNTMPFTSVLAEMDTPVVLENANVAVSNGPLGTVEPVQFAAWFQSPVAGLVFHVALLAKMLLAVENRSSNIATVTTKCGEYKRRCRESTTSVVDEEKLMVFFIILISQMTGASPRRCRRRPHSTAAGKIWCGAIDSPILFLLRLAGQDERP